VLARASDPPYDFIVVGGIQQGGSRGYDDYALAPAEAILPAPHTFDIEVSRDRSARRQYRRQPTEAARSRRDPYVYRRSVAHVFETVNAETHQAANVDDLVTSRRVVHLYKLERARKRV